MIATITELSWTFLLFELFVSWTAYRVWSFYVDYHKINARGAKETPRIGERSFKPTEISVHEFVYWFFTQDLCWVVHWIRGIIFLFFFERMPSLHKEVSEEDVKLFASK